MAQTLIAKLITKPIALSDRKLNLLVIILPLKGGLPMTLYDFLTLVFLVTICIVALKA